MLFARSLLLLTQRLQRAQRIVRVRSDAFENSLLSNALLFLALWLLFSWSHRTLTPDGMFQMALAFAATLVLWRLLRIGLHLYDERPKRPHDGAARTGGASGQPLSSADPRDW